MGRVGAWGGVGGRGDAWGEGEEEWCVAPEILVTSGTSLVSEILYTTKRKHSSTKTAVGEWWISVSLCL